MFFSPFDLPKPLLVFMAGVATVMVISSINERYREITWRDFINEYLSKERVEKLEVVNKKWVRVSLKSPEQVKQKFLSFSLSLYFYFIFNLILIKKIPWFSIGSVDAFERNLEIAQAENNPDSRNYVPIFYREEMEL